VGFEPKAFFALDAGYHPGF